MHWLLPPYLALVLPCMAQAQKLNLSWGGNVLGSSATNAPWGDSLFGEWTQDGSSYREAGVNDIRHLGWSWNPINTMTPPCFTSYTGDPDRPWDISGCSNDVADACKKVGGSLFGNLCMENPDKPFTVVGPDCWNKTCASFADVEEIRHVCTRVLGGEFVDTGGFGTASPLASDGAVHGSNWCLIPGEHTVLGPACYGNKCFVQSLHDTCESLGGTIYADLYCILDKRYSVVGPACHPGSTGECFPNQNRESCELLGGHSIEDVFCILEGEYSVLGPFCRHVGTNYTECFSDQGFEACKSFGGTPFGQGLYCAIEGSGFHYYSDSYGGGCLGIAATPDAACETELGGIGLDSCSCMFQGDFTVGAPTRWEKTALEADEDLLEKLAWRGYGFIMKGSYTIYGPNCYGTSCTIATESCESAGGISVAGMFCAMPTSRRRGLDFTTEGGLPNGIVFVLSLLCVVVFLQMVVIAVYFRRRCKPATPSMHVMEEKAPSNVEDTEVKDAADSAA